MAEKKYRLLVVDDEQDVCDILRFNFEAQGYVVETACSAEEALTFSITSFDLLILDVMLGGISGFSFAKKLKIEYGEDTPPIIFLSARDTEDDTIYGFNLGADDYISKPFSIREVIYRVQAVLRRSYRKQENITPKTIFYKGLSMDIDRKTVRVDGEFIAFTKTEFELLRTLMENPMYVFSRQELIDRVWPCDVVVLDRVVDVNIVRIRKKIGDYAECIITRLGYGYYFDSEAV